MNSKRFCTNCGNELKVDDNFCPGCGTSCPKIEKVEEQPKKRGRKPKIEEAVILDEKKEKLEIESKELEKDKVEVSFSSSEERETPSKEETEELKNEIEKLKKEKNKKILYPIISSLITFVACLAIFGVFYNYYLKNLVIETTKREVTVTDKGIAEAVDKVYDAVVVVESYTRGQLYSTGTGVVYKTDDNKGYILTNNHVIEGAEEVKVVFTNNERKSVTIVGADSYSDVAVLSVGKKDIITVAEIGSSEALKVGDTAFAVGAPLDSSTYAWTVTRGVISGKNRTVEVSSSNGYTTSVMEVLQTDTAINNGNSGGPLCNSNGEVIGITNMKLASSTIEGMGFAIPIETAVKYAEKFIKGENISYPYIGVVIYDARVSMFSPEIEGVYIESVEKNSPADKAGLKAKDKILKVEKAEISNSTYFKHELYKYEIGDKITITVERDGKEKKIEVTLGSSNPSA